MPGTGASSQGVSTKPRTTSPSAGAGAGSAAASLVLASGAPGPVAPGMQLHQHSAVGTEPALHQAAGGDWACFFLTPWGAGAPTEDEQLLALILQPAPSCRPCLPARQSRIW